MNHKRSLSFKVLIAQKPFKTEKDYKPAPRIFVSGAGTDLDSEAVFKRVHRELLNVPRAIIEQGKEIDHFCLVPQLGGRLYRPKYPFPPQFPFSVAGFKKLRTSMSALIRDIKNTTQNNDVRGYHSKPPYFGVMIDLIINAKDKPVHSQHSLADELVVPLVASEIQHHLSDIVDRFATKLGLLDHVYAMNIVFYKQGVIMSGKGHTFNDLKVKAAESHSLILSAIVGFDQRLSDKIHTIVNGINAELTQAPQSHDEADTALEGNTMSADIPTGVKVSRQCELQIYGEFTDERDNVTTVSKKIIVDIDDPDAAVKVKNEFYSHLEVGRVYIASTMSVPIIGTIVDGTQRFLRRNEKEFYLVPSYVNSMDERGTDSDTVNSYFNTLIDQLQTRYGVGNHGFPLSFNLVSTIQTDLQIGVLFECDGENHVQIFKKRYNLLNKEVVRDIKNDILAAFGGPRKVEKFVIELPGISSTGFDQPLTLGNDNDGILRMSFDRVGLPNFDEYLSHHLEKTVRRWNDTYLYLPFQPNGVTLDLTQDQIDLLNSKKAPKTLEKETKTRTKRTKALVVKDPVIRNRIDTYKKDLGKELKASAEQKMLDCINCIAKKIVVSNTQQGKDTLSDALAAISEVVSQTGAMIASIDKTLSK